MEKEKKSPKAKKNTPKTYSRKKNSQKSVPPRNSAKPKRNYRSSKPKVSAKPIRITPLGGLDEIGKNITLYEYENDMFLVDCGMSFPDEDTPGYVLKAT